MVTKMVMNKKDLFDAPVRLHLFLLLGKLQHCSNDLRSSIMAPSLCTSLSVKLPILQFYNYIIQLTDKVSVAFSL